MISTFSRQQQQALPDGEELKDEARDTSGKVESEIEDYTRAPDTFLDELPVDTTRFV